LRENCELSIMSPARQFREKCRKREITGEKRRFHSHTDDRPNYVSSQPRYDHFDTSPNIEPPIRTPEKVENRWREHKNERKLGELKTREKKRKREKIRDVG